jgi:sugar transferase EpsL
LQRHSERASVGFALVSRQVGWRFAVKQVFDRSAAVATLLVTAPLIAGTALAVVVSMGRPVFFRQTRPGRHSVPFTVWKFRTMSNARDAQGALLPDAERLGRVGRLIRELSLDELPQLINVARGELSLVGPRPLLMEYLERYSPDQRRRHDVMPGITGWAQVHGRNATTWRERFEHDVWYVDHWGLTLDAKILAMTVAQVLARKGISHQGHATMPEFQKGDARA